MYKKTITNSKSNLKVVSPQSVFKTVTVIDKIRLPIVLQTVYYPLFIDNFQRSHVNEYFET